MSFIIFFLLPDRMFILVATGFPTSGRVEIINVLDPDFKCRLTYESERRWSAVGGLIQNQPVICGGTRNANEELKDVVILGQANKTTASQKIKKSPGKKNS